MQTTNLLSVRDADIATRSLRGHVSQAKVVRVVDGDTVYIVAYEPFSSALMKVNCRLAGVDTPEMTKTPELAKRARNALAGLTMDVYIDAGDMRSSRDLQTVYDLNKRILYAKFGGEEKYGRELVELYEHPEDVGQYDRSINARMVALGYARGYDGGTKSDWLVV